MILGLHEHRYKTEAISAELDPSPLSKGEGYSLLFSIPNTPPSSSSLLSQNLELVRGRGGMAVTGPFPSVWAKVNPASFGILTRPHTGATEAPHSPYPLRSLYLTRAREHTHTRRTP